MTFTAHHFDPATQSYGPVEMGKGVTLSAKVDTNHRIMSDVWGCATHVTYWDEQAQHRVPLLRMDGSSWECGFESHLLKKFWRTGI